MDDETQDDRRPGFEFLLGQANDLGLLVEQAYPSIKQLDRFKAWLLQTAGVDSVDKLAMADYDRITQAVKGVIEKQKGGK